MLVEVNFQAKNTYPGVATTISLLLVRRTSVYEMVVNRIRAELEQVRRLRHCQIRYSILKGDSFAKLIRNSFMDHTVRFKHV